MVIKNESQLKKIILADCKRALVKAQERVYKIIDLYLQRFYADYDPVWYDRTYKLLHSLVKSDIRQEGNKLVAKVYFDLDHLGDTYNTGANPSGEDVMNVAAYGGHGAEGLKVVYGSGQDAWFTPLEIIDAEAINILRDMLIAEGIPLSKK